MVLRLVAVQMLVGIAQGDVERQLLFLESAYVSGVEHRTIGREVFQIAHVPSRIKYDGSFTVVWFQRAVVGMRSKVKRFPLGFGRSISRILEQTISRWLHCRFC